MTTGSPQLPPAPPPWAPPDLPAGPAPAPDRSVWPYALGAASIVVAGQQLLNLLGLLLQLSVMAGLGIGSLGPILGTGMGLFEIAQFLGGIIPPILAVLLLVAGLLSFRRSRLTVGLHLGYAIASILLSAPLPILSMFTFRTSGAPQAYMTQAIVSQIWRVSVSLVYPVFLLVWFRRPSVRRQVRDWVR